MRNWRASQRFQRKPTYLLLTCVYVYNQIFFSLDFILSRSWFVLFWFWFYTFDPDKRWKTCFQSYSFFACNNNVRHFGVPFLAAPFALLIASRSAGFRKPFHSSSWRTTTDKCRSNNWGIPCCLPGDDCEWHVFVRIFLQSVIHILWHDMSNE